MEKTWVFDEDPLIQKGIVELAPTGSLLNFTTWWLPLKGSYTFKFHAPTGKEIHIATTEFLLDALSIVEEFFVYYQRGESGNWMTFSQCYEGIREIFREEVLEPFNHKTEVPYNRIYLTKEKCNHFQSKVGGEPYMPLDFPWPESPLGTPLRFLAQINFGEAPGLPDFPEKGILQFYILENLSKEPEYTYGLSWNEPMAMTMVDHRFNEEFLPIYNRVFGTAAKRFYDLDDNLYDILYEETLQDGHRIGGYPHFAQDDPRCFNYDEKEILLFQLDSDEVEDVNLMWGDAGVANFFISREDLKK